MNLENLFSGAASVERTKNVTPRIEMKSGIASLKSVEAHTSKKGNKGVKLIFTDMANPKDESAGHIEYLSFSEAARFGRVFEKLAYLNVFSKNDAAKEAYATLPSPIKVLTQPVLADDGVTPLMEADGVTIKTQPMIFQSNEQLKAIREANGQDVTFLWTDDDSDDRIAVQFVDIDGYITKFIEVMNQFAGGKYTLKLGKDDNGFQKLLGIHNCKIA